MQKTSLIKATAICCGTTLISPEVFADQTQPNIIYILADDLGIGDIECYGQDKIKTPNINKLAEDGMIFTQHYSGSSVSAPSRCILLTGQHAGHAQIRGNKELKIEGQLPLKEGTLTLASLLKGSGYATGAFGKWGLGSPGSSGDPINQGFDEFFGYNCQRQAHRYYPTHLWHNDKKVILEGNDTKNKVVYAPDVIQEQMLNFIEENVNNPFFAYVSVVQPHAELIAPDDEIFAKYKGEFSETPHIATNEGDDYGDPNFKINGYCSQPMPRATFAAMVGRIDKYVGEIVDRLEELGIADNTIVIFSSDNGAHKAGGSDPGFFDSNAQFKGYKRDLTEGGIRTPMIVRWNDKIKPNSTSDHISAFWDILPTFADIIGATIDKESNLDGISMFPTLIGKTKKQKQHEALYWEFKGDVAVRMGDWKAIRKGVGTIDDAPIELYNLHTDVSESNDISSANIDIVEKATQIMKSQHTSNKLFPLTVKERENTKAKK